MVLGLRSSEREKEREKERIRESILKFTQDNRITGHRIRQEKYSRYKKLTLAPRLINYCSINTGDCDRRGQETLWPPDRAKREGYNPTHFAKAQPPHH